jgi:hypothetical protein
VSVAWTTHQLDQIGTAEELVIAATRTDDTLRRAVPVWVVRVGDELYVRSWRGTDGSWYRAAQASGRAHISAGGVERDVVVERVSSDEVNDAIDAGYRDKYVRYPSYVEPMSSEQARATTLRLVPADDEERG